jgi:hypothetical protein
MHATFNDGIHDCLTKCGTVYNTSVIMSDYMWYSQLKSAMMLDYMWYNQ